MELLVSHAARRPSATAGEFFHRTLGVSRDTRAKAFHRRLVGSPRSSQCGGKTHQPDKTKPNGRGAFERTGTDSCSPRAVIFTKLFDVSGSFFAAPVRLT